VAIKRVVCPWQKRKKYKRKEMEENKYKEG
jgi:hypothetical protein